MVKKGKLWHEKLSSEHMVWLTQKLLEGQYPVNEICKLFTYAFPDVVVDFSPNDLRYYAKNNLIGWSEDNMTPDIEVEIEKQVGDLEDSTELLTEEDAKKINAIKTHRKILMESWKNYRRLVDNESQNETAKGQYLDKCSRELRIVQELEEKEKSLVSMLGEIKKAEDEESAEDLLGYVVGYCLPNILRKSDIEEFKGFMAELKEKADVFVEVVEKSESKEDDEVIRIYLRKIYEYPAPSLEFGKEG